MFSVMFIKTVKLKEIDREVNIFIHLALTLKQLWDIMVHPFRTAEVGYFVHQLHLDTVAISWPFGCKKKHAHDPYVHADYICFRNWIIEPRARQGGWPNPNVPPKL